MAHRSPIPLLFLLTAVLAVACNSSNPEDPRPKLSVVQGSAQWGACHTVDVVLPDNSQKSGSECDASVTLRNDGGSNLASSVAALRNTMYGFVTITGTSGSCMANLQFVSHGKTENLHCTVRKWLGLGAIDTSQPPAVTLRQFDAVTLIS